MVSSCEAAMLSVSVLETQQAASGVFQATSESLPEL